MKINTKEYFSSDTDTPEKIKEIWEEISKISEIVRLGNLLKEPKDLVGIGLKRTDTTDAYNPIEKITLLINPQYLHLGETKSVTLKPDATKNIYAILSPLSVSLMYTESNEAIKHKKYPFGPVKNIETKLSWNYITIFQEEHKEPLTEIVTEDIPVYKVLNSDLSKIDTLTEKLGNQ